MAYKMLDVESKAFKRAKQKFDIGSIKQNDIVDVGYEIWDVIF